MVIEQQSPTLIAGQRISKSNGTLLPVHSPSNLGINCDLAEIKFDEFSKNCLTSTNKTYHEKKQGSGVNFDSQQVVIDLMEDTKKSGIN